jgi:hypothetical protein
MDKLRDKLAATPLGVKELPMTITRRCPKSHVRLAQAIDPNIRALDDAPEGEILNVSYGQAVEMMQPGDLVLCRVNAELIKTAYALIRRGVRPLIKGRDLGAGLLSLLDKLAKNAADVRALTEALTKYRIEEEDKIYESLGEDKGAAKIMQLNDKCDCLFEFISGAKTVIEIRGRIESLFEKRDTDETNANAVTLGTVHRTKGLEAERVFVLAPELLMHPAAKQPWEIQQERNICWVAATRAKFTQTAPGTLVFVGMTPTIYLQAPVTSGALISRGE